MPSTRFETADEVTWLKLVEKALKGGSADRLDSATAEGLIIKALNRANGDNTNEGTPGSLPYIRGGSANRDTFLPWHIQQIYEAPNDTSLNEMLHDELERGVSSAILTVRDDLDFNAALEGVDTSLAPIFLTPNKASTDKALQGAQSYVDYLKATNQMNTSKGALGLDPIGIAVLAETSIDEDAIVAVASLSASLENTKLKTITIDSTIIHEAGGSEAQELASLAALQVRYMHALMEAGMSAETAASKLVISLAAGSDYLLETAKIRAARQISARINESFGAEGALGIQSVTSRRMLTAYDINTNMLRIAAGCFAGAIGGADYVLTLPFTEPLGIDDKLSRRVARNTQIMAQEESKLGHVMDAPGGSWSLGDITQKLAIEAWRNFQAIEQQGGITAVLNSGALAAEITEIYETRRKDIAKRKIPITGLSEFADLGEDRSSYPEELPEPSQGVFVPRRLGRDYETLRHLADMHKREKGNFPEVFLATIGNEAQFSARINFTRNFLAAGGIEGVMQGASLNLDETISAFKASGAIVATICSSDALYEENGAEMAKALKAAGASQVYLAGKPKNLEDTLRNSGVDQFIYMGMDVVAGLTLLQKELGV